MSTQPNVKQLKPGTNNQILLTTGGVATWGNPLATTSALGEVALATQNQAFNGSPDTSGSYPLVTQPSGMLIRKNMTAGQAEIYVMASANSSATLASPNARGTLALDLQSEIVLGTEVASGTHSIAIGQRNTTTGNSGTSIGRLNTNSGYTSTAVGFLNSITSTSSNNHTFGSSNSTVAANTLNSLVMGTSNTLNGGQNNTAIGFANTINTTNSNIAIVGSNNTSGPNAVNSGMFGNSNTGIGVGSFVVGRANALNDTDFSQIFGVSNQVQAGASYCFGFGTSNSFQTINTNGSNLIAVGKLNNLNSVTNSMAVGIGNNIQGTSNQQNLMAFGNGNTINPPTNGFGTCGAFGQGNIIQANSARSWAFGEANNITSLNYGNGAGAAVACGISNLIQNGEHVYFFGLGNQSRTNNLNSVFADYIVGLGISNTAQETAHLSTMVGNSNVTGGGNFNTLVGHGNNAQYGGNLSVFGLGNTVGFSFGTSNAVVVGNSNSIGTTVTNADYTNVFGRGNSCNHHSNFFGQSNSFAANGNTNFNNNVFGRFHNSGAGGSTISVTNCECFGTANELGSINTFGPASVDQGITFGRYNSIFSNQSIAIGANNTIGIGSTTSTFVGWNNTTDSNAVNSGAFGTANSFANYTGGGSQSSFAIGHSNKIGILSGGVSALSASNALAIGSLNQASSDNCQVFGYGNFTGLNNNTVRSAIAIGILNNTSSNYATLNNSTGVISGGAPVPYLLGPVGINSIAIGSENLTLGLNSIAIGRHCFSTGDEAVSIGIRCVASGTASTAIGNRAVSRVDNTLNVGGLPIIRKDNGEAAGTEFTSFSGMPAIIQSKTIDLTTAVLYLIQLPIGPRFWIDEVGIEVVTNTVTSVTATPFVSWGTKVNASYTQKYRQIDQMFGLTVAGSRETFSTFENDSGETSDISNTVSLGARIEIGATTTGPGTYTGRFYWIGRYVEQ